MAVVPAAQEPSVETPVATGADEVVELGAGNRFSVAQWNQQGTAVAGILAGHDPATSTVLEQSVVVVTTGPPERVQVLTSGHRDSMPVWSSDGSWVAFTRGVNSPSQRYFELKQELEQARRAGTSVPEADHDAWLRLNAELLVTDVYAVDIAAGALNQLTHGQGRSIYGTLGASPDGKWLLCQSLPYPPSGLTRCSLLLAPVVPGVGAAPRLLKGRLWDVLESATWSPDSQHLAVATAGLSPLSGPHTMLYSVQVPGGKWRRCEVPGRITGVAPPWWQDNGIVLIATEDEGERRFWSVRIGSGAATLMFSPHPTPGSHLIDHSWSPTGRHVAASEWDGSVGRIVAYTRRGGAPSALFSGKHLDGVRWSPDGARIAFVEDGSRLHFLSVKEGGEPGQ